MTTECSFLPGLVGLCFSAILRLNNNIQCICKTVRKNTLQESLTPPENLTHFLKLHDVSECTVAALLLDMTTLSVDPVQVSTRTKKGLVVRKEGRTEPRR